MANRHNAPAVITTARLSRSLDADQRQKRYLITMGVRVLCVICAAVFDGWTRWVFVAGAALLPLFGVVLANLIDKRTSPEPAAHEPGLERPQLTSPDTIPGQVDD